MEEKKEKIFVDGMMFQVLPEEVREKLHWIKGRISIMVPEIIPFLEKHRKNSGWVNINLCKSQKGKYYLELDTWEPKKKEEEDTPNTDNDGRKLSLDEMGF